MRWCLTAWKERRVQSVVSGTFLVLGKVGFLGVVGVYSAWKASELLLTSLGSLSKVTSHLRIQCSHGKAQAWEEERFRSVKKTEGSSRASLQKCFWRLQVSLNQFVSMRKLLWSWSQPEQGVLGAFVLGKWEVQGAEQKYSAGIRKQIMVSVVCIAIKSLLSVFFFFWDKMQPIQWNLVFPAFFKPELPEKKKLKKKINWEENNP